MSPNILFAMSPVHTLPEGEGTDLGVFEFSGDQSGCSKLNVSPNQSLLPEGKRTDLGVFELIGDQSGLQ